MTTKELSQILYALRFIFGKKGELIFEKLLKNL